MCYLWFIYMRKTYTWDWKRGNVQSNQWREPTTTPNMIFSVTILIVLLSTYCNIAFLFYFFSFFEIDSQQANTKAHEAIDYLTSFLSSREEISKSRPNHQPLPWDLGIFPPSSSRVGSSRAPHYNVTNIEC